MHIMTDSSLPSKENHVKEMFSSAHPLQCSHVMLCRKNELSAQSFKVPPLLVYSIKVDGVNYSTPNWLIDLVSLTRKKVHF